MAGPQHIAVLPNPAAGRGRRRAEVAAALAILRETAPVRMIEEPSEARALHAARAAVAEGAGALVVIGGDGTVHLGLQAVAATGVPLGIIPAGTGNDFATVAGVPMESSPATAGARSSRPDLSAAAEAIAAAIATGRRQPMDLARLTGPDGYDRWFGAVLGAGFDAIVNERANAMRWPKGRRRYDVAIFAELLRLKPRPYVLTFDGEIVKQDAVLVAVGNTSSYGGGMHMCPDADPHDGLLDVVVAGPVSRTTLLRLQPKVFKGTHVTHPMVTTFRAQTVGIEADGITAYADGERTCPLPITITATPAALQLLL
jgi:diacylglycerol kinase (ATP)